MLKSILFLSTILLQSLLVQSSTPTTTTQSLQVYHRIIPGSIEVPPKWEKKALVKVDLDSNLIWLDDSSSDSMGKAVRDLEGGEGYYQIGVKLMLEGSNEVDNDLDEDKLSIIAIDTCHLLQTSSNPLRQILTLNFTPSPRTHFLHFSFLTNTKAFCLGKEELGGAEELLLKGKKGIRGGLSLEGGEQLELRIGRGIVPDGLRYREAKNVTIGTDGKVVPPKKEKSFVEKYWIYAVGILIALVLTGGEEESAAGGEGAAQAEK